MSKTGIPLAMVDQDGNAFAILGRARRALQEHDQADRWDEFQAQATAGDYDALLRACMV